MCIIIYVYNKCLYLSTCLRPSRHRAHVLRQNDLTYIHTLVIAFVIAFIIAFVIALKLVTIFLHNWTPWPQIHLTIGPLLHSTPLLNSTPTLNSTPILNLGRDFCTGDPESGRTWSILGPS